MTVLPLGRCADAATEIVTRLDLDDVVVVWRGPVSATPCSRRGTLLVALDGHDEQHLQDVGHAAKRWRDHGGGPVLVIYALPGVAAEPERRSRLSRLANLWNTCVVEPVNPGGAEGLAIVVRELCELLLRRGLVGLDPSDFASMTEPPSIARCLITDYTPGTETWKPPSDWIPILKGTRRGLLSIRCVSGTTISDINAISGGVLMHLAADAAVLIGSPESEGAPTVALVRVDRAETLP